MKAKLVNEHMPFEYIEFDMNPTSLKYDRTVASTNNSNASGSGPGSTPSIFHRAPPKTLQLDGYVIGDDLDGRIDTLFSWAEPGGGLLGQLIGAAVSALTGGRINLAAKPPPLLFIWGSMLMRCVLVSVTATHERFDSSANPTRSKISVKIKEEFNIFGMLPTNPTSGGLAGRQRHTVSASENLQTISTTAYGRPALWRGIAQANNIDDPFRVRPGDTVYLPNGNEILGSR
jgi:hypothetical protein